MDCKDKLVKAVEENDVFLQAPYTHNIFEGNT